MHSESMILIFGTNCVGKSTVGSEIARRLPMCSFIEVDELRYKIVSGLVAYSGGTHPREAPEEYERQCWMGVECAIRMAQVHIEHGFSVVIEGLENDCMPGTGWIEENLTEFRVVTVALVCDFPTLEARWADREGLPTSKQLAPSYEAYSSKRHLFDCFIDTGKLSAEQAAEAVISQL